MRDNSVLEEVQIKMLKYRVSIKVAIENDKILRR
jgi:hypothetical protein